MNDLGLQYYARRDPDADAVIDPSGEAWPRQRLAALVSRAANAFVAAGLAPADVVAVVAPNCAETLAVYLAAIDAGLYVVPVNWHLGDAELAFVIDDSGAKLIVAHERLGRIRLAALREHCVRGQKLVCIGGAPGYERLDGWVADHAPVRPSDRPRGRVMAYTSATTGRPKAVRLPMANADHALCKSVDWQVSLGIAPEDRNVHLCASMLYHSAPLEGALLAQHMGHCVVLIDHWEAELLLRVIARFRVTTAFMVPTMFVRLLKLPTPTRERYSTASLRFVIHGGAPCPLEVKQRMIEWWGPVLWEAYGAAEAQGTIVSTEEWLTYPGTVGRPAPGSAIRILGDDGRELPPGEAGLVYIKPRTGDRFEYHNDPSKTAASYRGELVTVGDIGYLNEQGYLFLCDRRSELILSSGMNIYPAEIEQILMQHPAVADCAVVGVPHELLGQVPKAIVQPADDATPGPALTGQLLRYLGEHLSPMKLPKRVEYVNALPRDPSGKLHRRRLAELAS